MLKIYIGLLQTNLYKHILFHKLKYKDYTINMFMLKNRRRMQVLLSGGVLRPFMVGKVADLQQLFRQVLMSYCDAILQDSMMVFVIWSVTDSSPVQAGSICITSHSALLMANIARRKSQMVHSGQNTFFLSPADLVVCINNYENLNILLTFGMHPRLDVLGLRAVW